MERHEGSLKQTKDIIRHRRDTKRFAVEHDSNPKGRRRKEEWPILDQAVEVVGKLKTRHAGWIKDKQGKLGIAGNDGEKDFYTGVDSLVAQEIRVNKQRQQPEIINEDYLNKVITGYAYDFYLSARAALRSGYGKKTALRYAQYSFRYNPDLLRTLKENNPDLNAGIIFHASISPDPEKIMQEKRETLRILNTDKKFKGVPAFVKNHAVFHYRGPRALKFAEDYQTTFSRLSSDDRYAYMQKSLISHATVNNSNPESSLDYDLSRNIRSRREKNQ